MKIIFILILFSIPLFPQVNVKAANVLYPKGNLWADSVTVKETSTGLPQTGVQTHHLRSTVALDSLYSNYHAIDKSDRNFRVFGSVSTDSVGPAPNDLDVRLEIGYFYGTGGFPDITGIEWVEFLTTLVNVSFDTTFTDDILNKVPQRIYFRFREVKPQQNFYVITLNVKKE